MPNDTSATDPQVPVHFSARLTTLFGWLVALILALWFFGPVSTVLLGLLAAAILAAALRPALRFIPGPRGLSAALLVLFTVLLVGGLFYALSYPLAEPIQRKIEQWPAIQRDTDRMLQSWNQRLGLRGEQALSVQGLTRQLAEFLTGEGGKRVFSGTADVILGILVSLALVVFGSIFVLAQPPDDVVNGAMRLLPRRHQPAAVSVLIDLAPRFRRWVLGTVTGMAIVFTATVIGFSIAGVEVALPLAILAGLAETVPSIGPAIAAVVLTLITLATQDGAHAVVVLVIYVGIQAFEAYMILPLIMRGAVKIHPAVTLFTVVLWGKVFGVPGLILAIPINLTIWVIVERFYICRRESRELAAG